MKILKNDIDYLVKTTGCSKKIAKKKIIEICEMYLLEVINNELLYEIEKELKKGV